MTDEHPIFICYVQALGEEKLLSVKQDTVVLWPNSLDKLRDLLDRMSQWPKFALKWGDEIPKTKVCLHDQTKDVTVEHDKATADSSLIDVFARADDIRTLTKLGLICSDENSTEQGIEPETCVDITCPETDKQVDGEGSIDDEYKLPTEPADYMMYEYYKEIFREAPLNVLLKYLSVPNVCEFTKKSGCGDSRLLAEVKRIRRDMISRGDSSFHERLLSDITGSMLTERIMRIIPATLEIESTEKLKILHMLSLNILLRVVVEILNLMRDFECPLKLIQGTYALLRAELISQEPVLVDSPVYFHPSPDEKSVTITAIKEETVSFGVCEKLVSSIINKMEKYVIPSLETASEEFMMTLSDSIHAILESSCKPHQPEEVSESALRLSMNAMLVHGPDIPAMSMLREAVQSAIIDSIGLDCVRVDGEGDSTSLYDPVFSNKLANIMLRNIIPTVWGYLDTEDEIVCYSSRVLGIVSSKCPLCFVQMMMECDRNYISILLKSLDGKDTIKKALAQLTLVLVQDFTFRSSLNDDEVAAVVKYGGWLEEMGGIIAPLGKQIIRLMHN